MRFQFLYSKNKEKEKLLNIYEEYQWFLDYDFPIVLPKFYAKLYQKNKNNKKLFAKALNKELNKIYHKNDYHPKSEEIKYNWRKIEQAFFTIIKSFNLRIENKYVCYISLYGPSGQFHYPNVVNVRASNSKDVRESNETIAHELLHLFICNKAKRLKLNYKQIEEVVDSFFSKTRLKTIFPSYRTQNITVLDKNRLSKKDIFLLKNFLG